MENINLFIYFGLRHISQIQQFQKKLKLENINLFIYFVLRHISQIQQFHKKVKVVK